MPASTKENESQVSNIKLPANCQKGGLTALSQVNRAIVPQPAQDITPVTLQHLVDAWSLTSEKIYSSYRGHQYRVAQLARAIGRELQFTDDRLQALYIAAMLHDIGKNWLPQDLWEKTDTLTDAEWTLVKEHPEISYTILRTIPFPWPIADIVRQHHEHFDGSGYPQSLAGEEIMIEARILAVADAVEALSSSRQHRPAYKLSTALSMIEHDAGSRYDPEIVAICQSLITSQRFVFV